MGVRQYHNRYRAYVVDQDRVHHQRYFDTEEQAQAFVDDIKKGKKSIYNAKATKRKSARHQDLPVGLEDYTYSKNWGGEDHFYNSIRACVFHNRKAIYFMRSYPNIRTRNEAIELCAKWRLDKLMELEKANAT